MSLKKELLKLPIAKIDETIPLLDFIYIIPTKELHDSGYRIMKIIGETKDNSFRKQIATFSDVLHIGNFINQNSELINMDIEPINGIIRFFTFHGYKIKVDTHGVSDFSFHSIKEKN